MRHRSESDQNSHGIEMIAPGSALASRSPEAAPARTAPGKHRAPVAPRLPEQKLPTHDTVIRVAAPLTAAAKTEKTSAPGPAAKVSLDREAAQESSVPLNAQWRASHRPRMIAATLLAAAVVGTAGLVVRYAQAQTSDNFVSLAVGLAVVVILWAVMIVSTPQVVTLDGTVLTVQNTGGIERFDLVDALQPVDLVGNPRTSYWALLLHRPNGTTLVLRHNDVDALELDPIVRHYRNVATQRFAEREARFNLKRVRPLSS